MSTGCSFPEGKAAGPEADHSPPSSAVVKKCVELYIHPQYVFMACCLIKHGDSFTAFFASVVREIDQEDLKWLTM
jgi:hypothetical protein